jgi:hypothetical protein
MARVKYSAEINELVGSVGGTVFQRNASGTISHIKGLRRGRSSLGRMLSNIRLNEVVIFWNTLSIAQQDAWVTDYGGVVKANYYGEDKTLTGFNWFCSINSNKLLCSQSMVTAPPAYTTPFAVPVFNLYLTDLDLEADWGGSPDFTDYFLLIYGTPPIRSLSLKNRDKVRLLGAYDVGTDEYVNMEAGWVSAFGISYPPSLVEDSFRIVISMAAVHKVSGISGQFTSVINSKE